MASRIKGITIELDGDTKGLDKALSDVNSRSSQLQKELKDVNRLLKFNPGNAELIAQKQKILAEQVENTREKLKRLQAAQADVDRQFAEGKINDDQYRAFQRELTDTESKLKNLEGQLSSTQSKFTEFGEKATAAGEGFKNAGSKMTDVGKDLSMKVTAPIVAIGAASAKMGMDFEAQMSRVGAISGATSTEMDKLTASALKLGADTSKSASEVAVAMEDMAAMGFSAMDIIGAMPGVISASEASGESLAIAAQTVAAALNIWGLEASEASRVADVLAMAANNSAAGIDDMQLAFKYAGAPAAALGIGMEDVAAAIGIMTDAGLDGSNAGTSLRASLLALNNPAKAQEKMMKNLGISMRDSKGNAISLSEMIGELVEATDGMTEADKVATLGKLVGTEAVSGFLSLMKAGPTEIDKMSESLRNSAGASKETADIMKDNLKGALEEFGGTLETIGIKIYNNLKPALESLLAFLQSLADKFDGLSPSVQNTILIIAGIAAAIGPILIVIGTLIGSIGALLIAFGTISSAIGVVTTGVAAATPAVGALASIFAFLTGPIGLAIAAIVAIGIALVAAYAKFEGFREVVHSVFDAVKSAVMTALNVVVAFIQEKLAYIQQFWTENGAQIKQAAENVWNGILAVIQFVMPAIHAVISVVWKAVQILVMSIWENIKGVISGALDIILGLVKTFSALFTGNWKGVWDGVKQIFSGAIELLWNAVQLMLWGKLLKGLAVFAGSFRGAITTMWGAIKGVFTSSINGIRSFFTSGFNAMKSVGSTSMSSLRSIITTVWSAIKTVFTSTINAVKNTVSTGFNNVVTAIRTSMSNAVSTIRTKLTEMLSAVTGKVKDFLSAGKDLIRGLIKGITDMGAQAVAAITGVVDSVVNKAKSLLGIKSPSRVFKAIGEFTGEGLAIGIASTKGKASDAITGVLTAINKATKANAQEVTKIATEAEKQRTATQKEYAQKRAELAKKTDASAIAAIKKTKNKKGQIVITGTEKVHKIRSDASAKLIKLNDDEQKKLMKINDKAWADMQKKEAELSKARLESVKSFVEEKKSVEQLSLIEEANIWRRSIDYFKDGTKEKTEAQKQYKNAIEAVNKEITSINKEYEDEMQKINENLIKGIEDVSKAYQDAEDKRTQSLQSFAGIFDEFSWSMEKSGQELTQNLQSQVDGFKIWQTEIEKLASKAVDEGLIAELREMGPKALPQLLALNSLTDEQLTNYSNLYKEKMALAREQAQVELIGMKVDTENQISEMRKAANQKLGALQADWTKRIQAVTTVTKDEFKTLTGIGKQAGQNLLNGLASMEAGLVAKARAIAKAVNDALQSTLGGSAIIDIPTMPTSRSLGGGSSVTNQTTNNSPTIVNNYYQPVDRPSELARKQTQNMRDLTTQW